MDIVLKQKLSKIFPGTELVIALSGGITKHEYRIEVEENEDDAVLTNESVVITVTVIGEYELEQDYICEILPIINAGNPEGWLLQRPDLITKTAGERSQYLLSDTARRGKTLFVVITSDNTDVTYLYNELDEDEIEIETSIPLLFHPSIAS